MSELTPLFDKKETCLYCKKDFTTKKLRSRFVKLENTDTDFCPYYKNSDYSPLLYFVKVCPACGFSFTEHFSSYFPPNTTETIEENIASKWTPQDFCNERSYSKAALTYKLALVSAQYKNEKAIVLAGILLRLTWIYRFLQRKDDEHRFTLMTINALKSSYEEAYYLNTEMTELRVLYLLGELHRRIGDFPEAIKNFSKVIEQQNSTIEYKIISLAREQWQATREDQKAARKLDENQ